MMYVTRIRKPSPVLSGPVLRTSHLIYLDRGVGVLRGDLSKTSHAHRFRCVVANIAAVPYSSYCYD